MYDKYNLTLEVDRLVGGLPKHPEIVRRWQEAKWPTNPAKALKEGDPATPEEAAAATVAVMGAQAMAAEEAVAGIWTGFAEAVGGQLALESRNVKAMLKESANILKDMLPVRNKAGVDKTIPLRSKLAERVFVTPKLIRLGATQASVVERPIHVMTAMGPRTALKRTDYLENVKVACVLTVLADRLITEQILLAILEHASLNGLGTDRSQGNGTFTYKLEKTHDGSR